MIALILQLVEAMRKDQRVPLSNSWMNYVRHKVAIGVLLKPENIACTTEGPFHKAKAFFTGLKLDI